MLLQQVAEAQNRSLVRSGGHAQINASEAAKRGRIIKGLFHAGVRQAEPLLQEISPQHDREAHWLPSVARLGIVRLNQRQQFRLRHHLFHLIQKHFPLALPTMLLKDPL